MESRCAYIRICGWVIQCYQQLQVFFAHVNLLVFKGLTKIWRDNNSARAGSKNPIDAPMIAAGLPFHALSP